MTLSVSNTAEAVDAIRHAVGSGLKLDIRGRGGKAAIGSDARQGEVLDASAIAGVVDYDPAELVLTVRPGTPLAEVEALLADHGQMLACEPLDLAAALGAAPATIGGTVAAGLAGSRRLTRGGVRDHLLGFTAVSGRGEIFVAGGKVVKNVTGYDLPKLMAGSWGRLALLTEVTLKVLPAAPEQATHVVRGLSAKAAHAAMARAMGSQAEVAAAAYAPASAENPVSITALRLEGIAPSLAARAPRLAQALSDHRVEPLEGAPFWSGMHALGVLAGASQLWRITLPARAFPALGDALDRAGAKWLADWAGGLVWTGWEGAPAELRRLAAAGEGAATLIRAAPELRAATPAFHPLPAIVDALEERVRRAFDPSGVFETGRWKGQDAD